MPTSEKQSSDLNPRPLWTEIGLRLLAYGWRTIINPRWLVMALFGRFVFIRSWVYLTQKPSTRPMGEHFSGTIFPDLDINQTVETLKADGLCLGINLPSSILKKLLQSIPTERTYKTEYSYGAQYATSNNLALENPLLQAEVNQLSQDPVLTTLAAQYLGTVPIYSGSKVWWSFGLHHHARVKPQPVHCFHYDLYDYCCLRFFFYLTDVDEQSGPHQFVKGSHSQRRFNYAFSPMKACTDEEILEYYDARNIITIVGSAGTGFAEDPFCFHKGTPPQQKDRLILMMQFVAHDYGVLNDRDNPFAFYRP